MALPLKHSGTSAVSTFPGADLISRPFKEWQGTGWWEHAKFLASPNFNHRPEGTPIDLLVLHSISLPPGKYGNGYVQQLFTNELDTLAHPYFGALCNLKVSSHFFITRMGVIWQFVGCSFRAWHAGDSAYRGRSNCNDFSIGIELEGLEGDCFEQVQYTALAFLIKPLLKAYPIAEIAGHEHIAPLRKKDPGCGFDWKLLKTLVDVAQIRFPDQKSF